MPKYTFKLEAAHLRSAVEFLRTDQEAKLHACDIADEINRNSKRYSRVLVFDQDGALLAAVSPIEE